MIRTDRRRFPILLAAIAALALAMALLFSPVQAQDGSAPDKPTGLFATATHDQVVLTWDDPGDASITGYVILRRVRVNDQGGEFSELVPDTGTAATTYTDDTVAASTTYTYRIKAINEHGVSERSRWFHIDTPSAPAPAKPTGLSATATHDQVVLTWDDPGDASITGYVILRRVRENDVGGEFSELAPNTGTAGTTYTDDTVAASTTYTYRIKAINEYGVSERSRWFHIDTLAAPTPEPDPELLAPSNLTAELTDGQVALGWDAPAEDAGSVTGYKILRAQGEGDSTTLVADTGSATTTHTDEPAPQASAVYAYRVKAIRDGELSQDSNEAQVQLPPAAPTGLLIASTHDRVTLAWNDPGDDTITGYRILRRDGDAPAEDEFTTIEPDTGSAETTYTDTDVEPSTGYTYRVQAISPHGVSGPSRDAPVNTPADPEPLRTLPAETLRQDRQNVSEPPGEDFPVRRDTPGRVYPEGSVTGNIDSASDEDAFAFDPVSWRNYRIDVEGADTGQGTLADPEVATGAIRVASNGDHLFVSGAVFSGSDSDSGEGKNALLIATFNSNTTPELQFIKVDGRGSATGTYRMTVTDLGASEPAGGDFAENTPGTVGWVIAGRPVTGNVRSASDLDAYGVDLEVGKSYRIDLEGVDTGQGTLDDPRLVHLRTDTGQVDNTSDRNSGEGKNARLYFTPETTETHLIVVGSQNDTTGTYRLSVNELPSSATNRTGTIVMSATSPFSPSQPYVSVQLTAEVNDPDPEPMEDATWQWSKSVRGTDWRDINGANSQRYTPTEQDEGYFLRATASYHQTFSDGTFDQTAHGSTGAHVKFDISEPPGADFPSIGTTQAECGSAGTSRATFIRAEILTDLVWTWWRAEPTGSTWRVLPPVAAPWNCQD